MKAPYWLLACLLLGLGLRAWDLGGPSLWLDEIGSVMAARAPLAELPDKVSQHLSPPLDYLVLKASQAALGRGDAALRTPALLWGLLAVVLAWAWARAAVGDAAARWLALLLALAPLAVAYSREARMYSLFLAESAGAWLLQERLCARPSWGRALALGALLGAALLTHYYAVLLAAGVLAAGAVRRPAAARHWLAAGVLALACFAPWTPWLLRQLHASGGEIPYGLEPRLSFFKSVLSAFASNSGFRDPWFYGAGLLAAAGAWLGWRRGEAAVRAALLVLALTLLACFGLAFWRRSSTERNFIFLLPPFLLLLARALQAAEEGLARRWPRAAGPALAGLLLLLLAPALRAQLLHGRQGYQPEWKLAARWAASQPASAPLWVPDAHSRGCLNFYLQPESETVFMAGRSLDPYNRPEDRVRVMGAAELQAAVRGRLPGAWLLPPMPLSFAPGEALRPAYDALYRRLPEVAPGQRPEASIHGRGAAPKEGRP